MKMKKIIYVIATVLLFAACSKDSNEDNNPSGGKKWVSFKIAIPQGSGTKAEATSVSGANHGDTYAGTVDERKITSVRVVLYDLNNQVAESFDLDATTNGTTPITGNDVSTVATATNTYFVSKGKEVLAQDYKMAVLINPTSAMLNATASSLSLTLLETAVAATVNSFVTTNGIMMSNSQGLVDVPSSALKLDAATAEGSPVGVAVDRSVAKVFVNVPSGGINIINSAAGDAIAPGSIRWLLDITNKKAFYLRKQAPMITTVGNVNTAAITGAETIDNSAAGRLNRYAEDPNWTGYNSLPAGDPLLTAEFNMSDETSTNFKTLGWTDADGDYVLENTMSAADQYEVETTRVLVKMNYVPGTGGIAAGADWLSYKGYIFTKAAFLDSFKVAIDSILIGIPATREMIGLPAGFKADMETIYKTNGGNSTPGQTYNATAEPDLTAAFVQNNLKFYLGGMSYYYVLIRHFDDSQQALKMAYGRYGVVRNNLYKIELASVKGPGEPVVVPPDGPDDKDTGYLSAEISVLPWLVRTQSVDL